MRNIVKIINIILPVSLLFVLFISKLSENTVYVFIMTLFIGWLFPYFTLLISGFAQLKRTHYKMGLVLNIISVPMCVLLIYLLSKIYDDKLLIFIIEYSIIMIMNIVNTIYYIRYLKSHPNKETEEIKNLKNKNNGAIV